MTLASTQGGATDPAFRAAIARIQPQSFRDLPPDVREVGPAYRVANPEGLELWKEQERLSTEGRPRVNQTPVNDLTWDNIGKITVPTQMFTGDADLYMPPPLVAPLRVQAARVRDGVRRRGGTRDVLGAAQRLQPAGARVRPPPPPAVKHHTRSSSPGGTSAGSTPRASAAR